MQNQAQPVSGTRAIKSTSNPHPNPKSCHVVKSNPHSGTDSSNELLRNGLAPLDIAVSLSTLIPITARAAPLAMRDFASATPKRACNLLEDTALDGAEVVPKCLG